MNRVQRLLVLILALYPAAAFAGDISLKQGDSSIAVQIDGKPFTTYYFDVRNDTKFVRPYFFPVHAADGTELTEDAPSDHIHHRSFWVAHGEVNGVDHWSVKQGENHPRQRHLGFDKVEKDTIVQRLAWESADRKSVLLDETRTMKFFTCQDGSRGVDLTVALSPAGEQAVTLGDTKEAGLCSVRLAKPIAENATITTAAGKTGEKDTWGKPAEWCDTSGTIHGKPYGVAILDHPSNPRHPSRWHVRAYGLMSANSFGVHDFDKVPGTPGAMKLEPGTTTTFKYRVLFHAGDAKSAKIADKFAEYAKP